MSFDIRDINARSNFLEQVGLTRNSLDHTFLPEIAFDENGMKQNVDTIASFDIRDISARSNFVKQVGLIRNSLDRAIFSLNCIRRKWNETEY